MTNSAKGFTITEIIIILVVIGILAAIGIPKYISVHDRNMLDTAKDFANSMATASVINYTECKHGDPSNCKITHSCNDFATLLSTKPPRNMQITLKPGTPFPTDRGAIVECQVIYASTPVDFKAIANP